MSKEKVLITGASGHSGQAIAKLLEGKYEVFGIDVTPGPRTGAIGDISNRQFVKEAMKSVQYVIHTASLHAPHIPNKSRADFVSTNIQGTLCLLEAASQNRIKRFVYTSTTSLYGQALESEDSAVWTDEQLKPEPRDIYDITKLTAEQLCEDFHKVEGLPVIVLRVSRFWDEPLPHRLFYRMYRGVGVDDVVAAHQLAMENNHIGFDVFNISAPPVFGKSELKAIKKDAQAVVATKVPAMTAFFDQKQWPMPNSIDRVYVIEKAYKYLGYRPKEDVFTLIKRLKASAH